MIENCQPTAGLDHVLCAEAPGQFAQGFHRVTICRIERVGCSELRRQLEASRAHIHRNDSRHRRERRGHNRDQADTAGAEDDDGAPRLRTCDVEDRAGAGLNAAAQGCKLCKVEIVVHLHGRPGADQGMRGKRRLAEEMPMQVSDGARERRATVQPRPAEQIEWNPVLTVDNFARQAGWAASAGIEAKNHLVANVELADLRPHLDDDARAFVAQHAR